VFSLLLGVRAGGADEVGRPGAPRKDHARLGPTLSGVKDKYLTRTVGNLGIKRSLLVKGGLGFLLVLFLSAGSLLAPLQPVGSHPQVIVDGDDPKIGTGG